MDLALKKIKKLDPKKASNVHNKTVEKIKETKKILAFQQQIIVKLHFLHQSKTFYCQTYFKKNNGKLIEKTLGL